MKNISVKAVILGALVLLLADGLGELMLAYVLNGQVDKAQIKLFYTDTPYIYWRTLEAVLALLVAGWVTAKLAKKSVYLNVTIVGVIAFLFTALAYDNSWHTVFSVLAFMTQIPFVVLGGYVVLKKQQGEMRLRADS